MTDPTNLSVAQAQEFARMGGYVEICLWRHAGEGQQDDVQDYANWIRAVGPAHDHVDRSGRRPPYPRPMPTAGMLEL